MGDRPSAPGSPVATAEADAHSRFDGLVRRYARLVAHAVRRAAARLGAHERADVEQDVLAALWKQVTREQDIAHPASYLYKAAVREAVRAVTKVHRRAEEPLDAAGLAPYAGPDAEATAVSAERREALKAALASLAPDRARAVKAHLAGWPVQDIMRMYGWPYQKARNLVARGMADLRAALRERGVT